MLRALGLYGWEGIERPLMAGVVGEFPVLLVGATGTAKTEGSERLFRALTKGHELETG